MIRVLEDQVINKIAAGEVVERPASVVKELVENALDAGAKVLRVQLEAGGRNLVLVADDGCGMDRTDATLCLERHATSKIRDEGDLFKIETLGFRGEAIPSIASVSRFELLTRPEGADAGTRVSVEGGRLTGIAEAGCPPGTQITVRSLFFNLPVRRKFLRTVPTEQSHSLEAVVRQVLLRPEVDVEVLHDGQTALRAPRVADLASRAADLLGPQGSALVPVSFTAGSLTVEGLISPVGVHTAQGRGAAYLYVNGRFVQDRVLRAALAEAWRGIVPKGRQPIVVIGLRLPPEHVDVNVHPAKTEVRFQHARELIGALSEGLRAALQRHGIKRPLEANAAPAQVPPKAPPLPLPTAAGPLFVADRPPPPPAAALPARPAGIQSAASRAPATAPAPPPPTPPTAPAPPSLPPGPLPDAAVGDARDLLPVRRFQDLRVLGQLDRTYVLCEGAGELVIVDQHAAHERITLHRLLRRGGEGGGQRLLTPLLVELAPAKARALEGGLEVLLAHGLEVEPFGGSSFAIKQVPAVLARADLPRLVADVADDLAAGGRGVPAQELVEKILATMACHTSVRAGQTLSPFEMRELLRALDEVDFSVCAHGRPVSIRISAAELARRFHRT